MPHDQYENAKQALQSGAMLVLCYRIEDAVRVTGISRSKLYELIAAGELQVAHFGRAVRITGESLRALIARRTEPARQSPTPHETRELLGNALARATGKSKSPTPPRTAPNKHPEMKRPTPP